MGISERREREKKERRRTILNCARELILQHGPESVSMEDIALRAELSKATLYLYFPKKEVLFNDICEDASRVFLESLNAIPEAGLTGIKALKYFWRRYVDMFGNFDEMAIIFQVRSFLNSWLPIVAQEGQSKSPYVDGIIMAMKTIIDQCKAEGVFDPDLDSAMATRLLLSLFSVIVGNAARIPPGAGKSPAVIEELTNTFQIIIRGFAREGIDRSSLDITGV